MENYVTHTSSTLFGEISTAAVPLYGMVLRYYQYGLPGLIGHTQEPKVEIASSNAAA